MSMPSQANFGAGDQLPTQSAMVTLALLVSTSLVVLAVFKRNRLMYDSRFALVADGNWQCECPPTSEKPMFSRTPSASYIDRPAFMHTVVLTGPSQSMSFSMMKRPRG